MLSRKTNGTQYYLNLQLLKEIIVSVLYKISLSDFVKEF
ncbi:hypothetical protein HJ01_02144 [Flavobacterium frigoris PS1]|uniref:Uncharacterized protein n=1 Tax=Flavobacterium frigoris (strain PS1) TaxID=1086011 RepID=H7FRZ4_FLAFP|nr:hypothetical protein HJ01_02144 [Flavobacterium frigoris PS1]